MACLKDIKRWLKLYDEKLNRLDVARCLAEAELVNGDLLAILAAWPEEAQDDKLKSKIALAARGCRGSHFQSPSLTLFFPSGTSRTVDLANREKRA